MELKYSDYIGLVWIQTCQFSLGLPRDLKDRGETVQSVSLSQSFVVLHYSVENLMTMRK